MSNKAPNDFCNRVTFSQHRPDGTLYQDVIFNQYYSDKAEHVEDGFALVGAVAAAITEVQSKRAQKGIEEIRRKRN